MSLPEGQELRKQWEDFKKLNNVDCTLEEFMGILREEESARQAAAERETLTEGGLEGSRAEESNAKCMCCAGGLSIIEAMIYGNRCVFCADIVYGWSLIDYLMQCFYDRAIYYEKLRLIKLYGAKEASLTFYACLGNLGFIDINQVSKLRDKKNLLRELQK